MMNCIIVDDEPIARRGMKRMVGNHPRLHLLAALDSAEAALDFLADNPVDLLFLDIQMPGLTGMELARRLPEKTMVIFTTAYSDYAVESYAVDAVGYLLKPIDPELFEKAVSKAEDYSALLAGEMADADSARPSRDYIIVKADRRFHRVPYRDILYVEGLKDYVILHLADGRRMVTRMTVKGMEEILPDGEFLRISKSSIVNIGAIDSFDNNDVFIGDAEIAIGLSYRDAVMGRLLG